MSVRLPARLSYPALVAAFSLLCPLSTALGVQGAGDVRYAPEARDHRVATPAVQARLNRTNVWKEFLDRRGGQWTARWDEATRTPVRFYGEGWAVDPEALADDVAVWDLGYSILAEEVGLLGSGVTIGDLEPWALDRRQGITTVSFRRLYAGLPVDGARVSLRFKHDRFVMGQFESMPGVEAHLDASPKATFPAAAVFDAAVEQMSWKAEETDGRRTPVLVVLPLLQELTAEYRLAWRIAVESTAFPSKRMVHIDAETGKLLQWEDSVRFAEGHVHAELDDRYPGNGTIEAPLPYAQVSTDGDSGQADLEGAFDLDADAPVDVTVGVGSNMVRMISAAGPEAEWSTTLSTDGDTITVRPSDISDNDQAIRRTQAQLLTHAATHAVRARALVIDPGFAWASRRVTAEVNLEGSCNAYYDGDIHFLSQSQDCNNTGRVADVVYHEYGHGFHAWSIIEGVGAFDGALSEGLGDYMAATMTGDPGTGRGFFRSSARPLRDVAPNNVWPDDIGEIHYTGIIIAGALFDLRYALSAEIGADAGIALADQFFLAAASRATDIPTTYEEILLADDDNGNLADGTPNKCLIDEQMGLHGLGPAAPNAPLFDLTHTAAEPTPDAEIALEIAAGLARPDCSSGSVDTVRVRYSFENDEDLDDFETIELAGDDGGQYDVTLPAAPDGTLVRYRIEVLDDTGSVVGSIPEGSFTDPWFGLWVGTHETIFFADFEEDDGGFTHELLAGDRDREGADDWGWGTPQGDSGDPDFAFSGDRVWGNDITPADNWNGAYQPNVHNVLRSPPIDVEGVSEVHLQFRRWLTVEDGFFDSADIRVNGRTIWTQHAGNDRDDSDDHHIDLHWAMRSYDVTDLLDATGTLNIEWELVTDGGLQLGGWNLDDVRVVARFADENDVFPNRAGGFMPGNGCAEECNAAGGATPSSAWLLIGLSVVVGLARRRRA